MASNNEKREGTLKWSDDEVKILCDVCINFIRKNGRATTFNWKSITIELNQKINRNCISKVVKNKFDYMRKDWYTWKKLLNRETGLGRNHVLGKTEASDEWWTRKITENKEAKRFRNKEFSFSIEELYHEIFEGKHATDENVVAPGMDPSSVNVVNVEEDEVNEDGIYKTSGADDAYSQHVAYSSRIDKLENQEHSFYNDFLRDATNSEIPHHTTNGTQVHSRGGAQASFQNTKTTTTKSTQVKRKRRQSAGSAILSAQIADLSNTCNHALELMESDSNFPNKRGGSNNSAACSEGTSIVIAMNIVENMIVECHLEKDNESWCFLMHLLEYGSRRKIFINMDDNVPIMAWLRYMHAREK